MGKRPVDVVVLSDIHLGTYGCRATELLTYLRSIEPQLVVLNGDIIDIWQFSKRYFPASHMAVLNELLSMVSNGVRVIYITGNHDEHLRRYGDLHLGKFQLTDKLLLEIDQKITWIFHGDAFDNTSRTGARFWAKMGSSGYALLLGANRLINQALLLMGREKLSLSKSVMEKVNKAIIRINDFETMAAELAIEKKYDYVICGHIHQPQKRIISNGKGSVMYMNCGDWVEHLTALEYYNKNWQLYTYNEKTMKLVVKQILPDARVMPEAVDLYLHSLQRI